MPYPLTFMITGGRSNMFYFSSIFSMQNVYKQCKLKNNYIYIIFFLLYINMANADILEKYNETKDSSDNNKNEVKHTFIKEEWKKINPLFISKNNVGIKYISTLGLGQEQTLILNGNLLHYDTQHYKYKNIYSKFHVSMSMASVLTTTLSIQNDSFLYGMNLGFISSLPLNIQGVTAHAVFGGDFDFNTITKQVSNLTLHTFAGIDFLYNQLVFRPFVGIYGFIPFSDTYKINMLFMAELGLKTFYNINKALMYIDVSMLSISNKSNANIFALMSNGMPLLDSSSLRFDIKAGAKYFAFDYLSFNAELIATYLINRYNVNAGINMGASYNF